MGNRTGKWVRVSLAVAILVLSGAWSETPDQAYQHAWIAYVAGDLPRAIDISDRNLSRWASATKSKWYWRFRLLEAEALTAQGKVVKAEMLLRDAVPNAPELDQLEVQRLIDQINARPNQKTADAILARARAAVKSPELSIRLRLLDGTISLTRNEIDAAENSFHEAFALAQREQNAYWQAWALNNLAHCSKLRRRYEDAIDFGVRALKAAQVSGGKRIAAFADGNLGSVYSYVGDTEAAFAHEERAIRAFREMGAQTNLMIALGEIGIMYDRQGEGARAIGSYRQAYEISRELGSERDALRFAENLSSAYINSHQWDQAENWNEKAAIAAPGLSGTGTAPFLMRNRASIAYGRGQLDASEKICLELNQPSILPSVRWEADALLGRIHVEQGRLTDARRDYDNALKLIEQARAEFANAQNKITFLSRLISFYQDYVDVLVESHADVAALQVVESSRARVLAERIGGNAILDKPVSIPRLKALAAVSNSAFLSFWLAPRRSFAWLITGTDVIRIDLPPIAAVERLVDSYSEIVEHSLTDPLISQSQSGSMLWSEIMAPIWQHVPGGTRLFVIPDGPLVRLNLETLPVPGARTHYFIDDVELAIAPSLSILAAEQENPAPKPRTILLIGDPDYSGTQYRALASAGEEIRSIESHFPGAERHVYIGAHASPAAYLNSKPGRFSIIHFAAHAETADDPLDSAVVLSPDGNRRRLSARDIIESPIYSELVTISACRGAGARAYAGEGLIGLAWAFLHAGARSVTAGLWDVNDNSTAALMNSFYFGIAQGMRPEQALRAAKLALLNETRLRKPYYWAAFQVYTRSVSNAPI